MLDDGGEPDPREPHEAAPELGVEQARRAQTDLCEAGQILGSGMQDPLDIGDDIGDGCEIGTGDRVDQPGARALAPDLDEISPLTVSVARCTLCVDGHRSGPRRDGFGRAG